MTNNHNRVAKQNAPIGKKILLKKDLGIGTFNIIGVERASLGTLSSNHNNGVTGRVFSGSFNIVGSEVHFTDAPKGTNIDN